MMKSNIFQLFALLIFVCEGGIYAQLPFTIEEMAKLPESVSNNAVCEGFVNGEAYVYSFGGIDSTLDQAGIHLKSWRYSTVNDIWEVIDSLPDTRGKIAAGATRVGDVIYIMGGYYVAPNGNETSSDNVHRFHTPSNSFISDGAPIPVAIDDHVQAVWRDSLIYVITGWSNTTNVPNVQIYNPSADSWMAGTPVPNNNLYKVFGASGAIIGDTIYYYGGAGLGFNFPATFQLRKGVINPLNPSQITWSIDTLDTNLFGYRTAAIEIEDTLFFLGGSATSYNYDAIAYNGSGVVNPSSRIILSATNNNYQVDSSFELPMDLRGLAKTGNKEFYLVGGIEENALQSKKLLKFTWRKETTTRVKDLSKESMEVYPNPVANTLYFKNNTLSNLSMKLFDLSGRKILEEKIANSSIDVSSLNKGIYILQIETEDTFFSTKIVKD